VQKTLEDAGITLDSVASDVLGMSGRAMLKALVAGERDPEVLAEMAKGRLRPKIPQLSDAVSGVVFLIGAGFYALPQRSGAVDFNATPVSVGVIAIIAGLASSRRRAIATGLVLAGWGPAVLLVAHGTGPPARTTPAYMLGIGSGLVVAAALAPRARRGEWLTSGAIAAALGPSASIGPAMGAPSAAGPRQC